MSPIEKENLVSLDIPGFDAIIAGEETPPFVEFDKPAEKSGKKRKRSTREIILDRRLDNT